MAQPESEREEAGVRHMASRVKGRLREGVGLTELLGELSAARDPWLRTCAVFAIGSSGARDLLACAEEALSSPDEKLRQVGEWARARLAVA